MRKSLKIWAYGVCSVLCALLFCDAARASSYRDQSLEILNQWTSIRWGEENLAWAVYYPESLIEPWIRADAERRRLRTDQIEIARSSMIEELKIDSTTPILLTIQVFGSLPVNISPIAEKVSLIKSDGSRVRPIVVEKKLESPITSTMSGLIFFPKQSSEDFSLGVIGLVPEKETIFSFDGARHGSGVIETTAPSDIETTIADAPVDEVVVKIPTAPQKDDAPPAAADHDVEVGDEGETFAPTQTYVPETAPTYDGESSEEIAPSSEPAPDIAPTERRRTAPMAPRQALDIYLRSWISGNTDVMYDMLTDGSRDKISKELFDREVLNSSFRKLLKAGYKVTWNGDHSAKVTVTRKLLFMRSLESKTINFTEEDGTARVEW